MASFAWEGLPLAAMQGPNQRLNRLIIARWKCRPHLNRDVVMRVRTGPHVCMHCSEGKGDDNATADSGWGTELP